MVKAIAYAVPVFLLMLILEAVSYRFLPDDTERGFEVRDTATSLSMGVAVYGLTKKISTYNPVRVAFGEYAALWQDVRAAGRWRDRVGYVLRPTSWTV